MPDTFALAILFHASLMPLILNVSALSAFDVATVLMVVFGVNGLTIRDPCRGILPMVPLGSCNARPQPHCWWCTVL